MGDLTRIAVGHNNPGGLVTLDPQPDYDGIQYPREIYTASGDTLQDGKPFAVLRFPDIVSPADWWTLLAWFNLRTAKTGLVTAQILNPDKVTSALYNGRAVRPEYGQGIRHNYCWYEGPVILVKKLAAI